MYGLYLKSAWGKRVVTILIYETDFVGTAKFTYVRNMEFAVQSCYDEDDVYSAKLFKIHSKV